MVDMPVDINIGVFDLATLTKSGKFVISPEGIFKKSTPKLFMNSRLTASNAVDINPMLVSLHKVCIALNSES